MNYTQYLNDILQDASSIQQFDRPTHLKVEERDVRAFTRQMSSDIRKFGVGRTKSCPQYSCAA